MNVSLGDGVKSARLTGNVVGEEENDGNWFILTLVLIVILGGLFWIAKRRE